jgi:hypothetical protein
MIVTSPLPSPLPSAAAFADLASITVEQDQALDKAERRVRGVLRAQERSAARSATAFLREIEGMISKEREGKLALTEEELTALIDGVRSDETDLKSLLRSVERAFQNLEAVAARDGVGRRDLVRLASREFRRNLSRHVAAIQEGRWMLIGIRDGREPRGDGAVAKTPQELRELLTTS